MATMGTRSDPNKVLLGCPRRGPEVVRNYPFDTLVAPGVAGCLNSDGEFVVGAANPLVGISRGVSMDHADRNSVTLRGKEVPLALTDSSVAASLTRSVVLVLTAVAKGRDGNDLTVVLTDTVSAGAEVASVVGNAITIAIDGGTSTATQVKAAVDASAPVSALITATLNGSGSTVIAAATVANLTGGIDSYEYVVPGAAVHVALSTGFAVTSGGTAVESNWKYDSEPLDGEYASGDEITPCALVNM